MQKTNKKLLAVDIAECAIFAALMVVGAYVTIPFYLVPLTFQTVISVLAGLLLGWKKGIISMSVYCFAGLIGIPVFAAGGGIFYVVKPSFGYILGFILCAGVSGLIAGKKGLPFWRYIVGALAGFLADYLIGIPYCLLMAEYYVGVEDILGLFITGNLLYMPKDAVLSILAGILAWRVLPIIDKGRAKVKEKPQE